MINFPDSPTLNQIFQGPNGISYTWNGTLWLVQNTFAGGSGDFCATASTGPAITGSFQTLIPTTILSGNAGLWYSTSTGRWTPPAGRYALTASMSYSSTAVSSVTMQIRKNGVTVEDTATTAAANGWITPTLPLIVDANGTDWFDMQAMHTAGTSSLTTIIFQAFPLTGMQGPSGLPFNPTGGQTFLAANVALNNVGTVFNIVNTGSIGAAGQVFDIEISANLADTVTAQFNVGIHDGTNYVMATTVHSSGVFRVQPTLSVKVTLSTATTFTLRVQDATSANGLALAAAASFGGISTATYIKWTRVA